jgi:HlyD family secretion protein
MKRIVYILLAMLAVSCSKEAEFDAQGTFEATEVTISAEATGRILTFAVEEGTIMEKGQPIAEIDSVQLCLQRKQLEAQLSALLNSRPDVQKQVASIKEQIASLKIEQVRFENLLRDGAATKKQKDDIDSQIRILETKLSATLSTLDVNTASINSNAEAVRVQIAALDDRIAKCHVTSPISGTVLVKYAQESEFTTTGKPLVKLADLNNVYLRAYFTSDQLSNIKLGDEVTVTADFGGEERYDYVGRVMYISSESEFTPKTIQTKDSRANLVYAVKIAVKNDGRLKIGLAGEVKL